MSILDEIMTLQEAAEKWNIDDSTLRHYIKKGKFHEGEIRKSASTWIVLKSAMTRLYGDMPEYISLYTTGYEGKTIEAFIKSLQDNDINVLFDVREIPNSRKKGFSKDKIRVALEESGIKYVHFKELGSPKVIRDKLHNDHDYSAFFKDYRDYLETQAETMDIINTSIASNKHTHFCLMCFEQNWQQCHRSAIADKISNTLRDRVEIINL